MMSFYNMFVTKLDQRIADILVDTSITETFLSNKGYNSSASTALT